MMTASVAAKAAAEAVINAIPFKSSVQGNRPPQFRQTNWAMKCSTILA